VFVDSSQIIRNQLPPISIRVQREKIKIAI